MFVTEYDERGPIYVHIMDLTDFTDDVDDASALDVPHHDETDDERIDRDIRISRAEESALDDYYADHPEAYDDDYEINGERGL